MKYLFLVFTCLGTVHLACAQSFKPAAAENRITIIVSTAGLSISCKNKEVTVYNNVELDSCMQKIIPGLNHLSILSFHFAKF